MQRTAKKIQHILENATRVLLIPHQNPDGDALGSVTAFLQYLSQKGVDAVGFSSTKLPAKLAYLPMIDRISTDVSVWETPDIDVIVAFDSGDLAYAGVAEYVTRLTTRPTVINIDHHATNIFYGDHNLVDATAASTTEIISQYFVWNKLPITKNIATSLLTGLITDTDNFTNGATSARALTIGGDLINRGADLKTINEWYLKQTSVSSLKVWGIALDRLNKHEKLDIVYTHLKQEDLATHSIEAEDVEGIANFLNRLGEGKATLIVKELEDGQWKGSFRTSRDDVDVSLWAKALGGGGHKKAAGFTTPVGITDVFAHIFAVIAPLQLEPVIIKGKG